MVLNSSFYRTGVRKMCNTRCRPMLWSCLFFSISHIYDVTPFVAFSQNMHASEWMLENQLLNFWSVCTDSVMWKLNLCSPFLSPSTGIMGTVYWLKAKFLKNLSAKGTGSLTRERIKSIKWDWRRLMPQCLVRNVFQYLKSVSWSIFYFLYFSLFL